MAEVADSGDGDSKVPNTDQKPPSEVGDEPSEVQDNKIQEEGSENEEESEYEIDKILDAKRGYFSAGKMGYFVSWKGYPASENCWVSEGDAINAQDLIDDFWKRRKAEKKARKPIETKAQAKGRKSAPKDDGSDADSAVASRKRGRKSNAKDFDSDNAERPSKRKTKDGSVAAGSTHPESEEDVPIGNMKRYMSIPSWEHLVTEIDTVERTDSGNLDVYFRLKGTNERVKEASDVCKVRFPQKLLNFYEANLRWKVVDGPDAGED